MGECGQAKKRLVSVKVRPEIGDRLTCCVALWRALGLRPGPRGDIVDRATRAFHASLRRRVQRAGLDYRQVEREALKGSASGRPTTKAPPQPVGPMIFGR